MHFNIGGYCASFVSTCARIFYIKAQRKGTNKMAKKFWWREFDVRHILPIGWDEEILNIASSSARSHTIIPKSVTSREMDSALQLPVLTVGGEIIKALLPWFCDLYEGQFRRIAQHSLKEPVPISSQCHSPTNLNLQKAVMRYHS